MKPASDLLLKPADPGDSGLVIEANPDLAG